MKQLRHVLALTLVFCMVFGMVTPSLAVSGEISVEEDYGIPVEEDGGIEIEVDDRSDYDIDEDREELSVLPKQDETDSIAAAAEYDYSIVHVDCGRKYFSPTYLKQIIDSAKAGGFNQVELYLSDNQGFRLALDDMTITTDYGTYDLTPALGDGYNTSDKTTDGSGKYLTQSEMTDIIKYANGKGIDIVPCINVPGHMGAILEEFTSFRYSGSKSSIDLENKKAIQFALEITRKYAKYFKEQGVKYYNIGADEYANDINAGMGFARLENQGKMSLFYDFLNKAAEVVVSEGLIPRAFNDGIYYANDDSWATLSDENGEIKYPYLTQIQVCYWSSGWGYSYNLASATTIAKHNPIINTNGDYYWILGGSKCTADSAKDFKYKKFIGNSTINAPEGAMFCIWCDYGDTDGADDGKKVADDTAPVIVAFGGTLPETKNLVTNGGTTDPAGETVTVTVGGTITVPQDGVNNENNVDRSELDESIATVVVTGTDAVAGNVSYKSINSHVSYSTVAGENTSMAKTDYYYKVDSNYYPVYAYYVTEYFGFYTVYYIGYSTTDSADNVTLIVNGKTNSYFDRNTLYTKSGTDPVPASTTITITGKTVGTTYITVGGVRYTINVVAEDLTKVTPIRVEYWITNGHVTGSDNATSKKIAANTVYGEAGYEFADLVPANGRRATNDEVVFWKGTRLTSDNKQTTNDGVDKTRSGDDFTYIRYWNKKWSFSADGVNWKDFNSDDQIVAYYLQKTNVTDEINTEVVDWGVIPHTNYTNSYSDYVLLDYAVRYQSGDRSPNSFPVNGKTQAFHCNSNDTTTVHYKNGEHYRQIGMVRAKQTSDYEVYMITLTPTSSTPSTYISSTTSYEYDYSSEEKVIWVDDADNLGDFADSSKWFTSISGDYDFSLDTSVGGDPIVPGLEIYNRHGMLVTYYIRAKATPDSLTVHYMDRTNGDKEFYSYPINVNQGTTFKTGPYLPEIPEAYGIPTHINNGDVVNSLGKIQYVSSVLATMPEINVAYRYSSYECVKVVRSEDGKDLYLYYTFKNTHSFVVDFGVPLHLTTNDIIISGDWTSYTATQGKYGTVEYNGTQIGGGITYTPTEVMQGRDEIAVTLTGANGKATHFIYLYPATNVLYEENVITNPGTEWTTTGTSAITATTTQATEKLGEENLHGYDDYYSENTGFSGGSAYKATLDASKTATEYGNPLTFEFTGNGFDLISECGPQTGALLVRVYKDGVLNHGFFVDTYFTGDTNGIISENNADEKGVLDYQVPVVRDINLTHGTYKVEVYGYMVKRSATSTASLYSVDSAETYLEQALRDLGLDDDASLYEVSFMDENSVLNDNAVASDVVRSGVSVQSMADEVMAATDNTQYVYVDGIRVYGTLENNPGYTAKEVNTKYYNVYDFALNSSAGVSDKWDNNSLIYVEKDGNKNLFTIADYKKQGPENEIYLTSGNAVAFVLDGYSDINSTVHISAKAVSGAPIFNGQEVLTNTEMYYDVSELVLSDEKYGKYIVLKNDAVDDTVLSISGIKVSSNIELIANADFGEFIVKELTPAQDDEFKPETFKASIPKSVKKNRKFSISASASADVQEVVVKDSDGNVIISKTQDKANNSSSPYRYSLLVTAPNISGNYSVKVYAKDVNGKLSAPIELTIEVK